MTDSNMRQDPQLEPEIDADGIVVVESEDRIIDVDARPVPPVKRAPQPGDMVSPDEVKDLEFPISRFALWGYNFRQNLGVFFGWNNLTKVQKFMIVGLGGGTTSGVVGWVTGAWEQIFSLFT